MNVDDNKFGVPAGWYPDPLGLPQLRWWDAQAWTEHTSEARAPIVIQAATRLGFADDELPIRTFADDELPSRREQRERERRENGESSFDDGLLLQQVETEPEVVHEELSAQPLLAMTLKELEPPLTDSVEEATPGPKRATAHANAVPAASTLSSLAEEIVVDEAAPERVAKKMKTYTAAVWTIAAMPLIQLALAIGLIVGGLGHNLPLLIVIWVGPYLAVLFFAAFDKLLLQTWGHHNPASALWAFLTAPGYLLVRAIRTFKETGKGFATLAVFAAGATAVLAGILVLPGLLISVLPNTFAVEAEKALEANALSLGAVVDIECPATPPLLIGQQFTCLATKPTGESDSVLVSLQRLNGWISWQVDDWGVWVLTDK